MRMQKLEFAAVEPVGPALSYLITS